MTTGGWRNLVTPVVGGIVGGLLMYTVALVQPNVLVASPAPSMMISQVVNESTPIDVTPAAHVGYVMNGTIPPRRYPARDRASRNTTPTPSLQQVTPAAPEGVGRSNTSGAENASTTKPWLAGTPVPNEASVPRPPQSNTSANVTVAPRTTHVDVTTTVPSPPPGGTEPQKSVERVARGSGRPRTSNTCFQAVYEERSGGAIRIATVGDSLSTESMGNAFKKRSGQPAYTAMLAKMLKLEYTNVLYAYVGHTAAGVHARAKEDLGAILKAADDAPTRELPYDVCFALVGTNDWLSVNVLDDFLLGWRRVTALCDRIARVTVLQAIPPYRCMASGIDREKAERFRVVANGCMAAMVRHDAARKEGNVTCPSGDVVAPLRSASSMLPGTRQPSLCVQKWLPTTEAMIHHDTPSVEPSDTVFLDFVSVSSVNRTRADDPEAHRWFTDCVHMTTEGKGLLASQLVRFLDAGGLVRRDATDGVTTLQ